MEFQLSYGSYSAHKERILYISTSERVITYLKKPLQLFFNNRVLRHFEVGAKPFTKTGVLPSIRWIFNRLLPTLTSPCLGSAGIPERSQNHVKSSIAP